MKLSVEFFGFFLSTENVLCKQKKRNKAIKKYLLSVFCIHDRRVHSQQYRSMMTDMPQE